MTIVLIVEIKQFEKSMIDEIVRLFKETILTVNRKDYSVEQVEEWAANAQTKEEWIERLDKSFTCVAVLNGEIVGFSNLTDAGLIDLLYVHKDRQGEGVGTKLVKSLEAEAERQGMERLMTEASITAKPFFRSRGYQVKQEQAKLIAGMEFINYRMMKELG